MPQSLTNDHLPSGFSVSLVEDESVLREEIAFQLRQRGFDVNTFCNAEVFYRFLATRPRTVAVLDIGLPGEDGLTIARHLRAHDPQMGLVFLTARHLREDRLEGLSAGADAYLVKPVDLDELVLVLNRLIARCTANSQTVISATSRANDPLGLWLLQIATATLQAPDGSSIRLTISELQLLQVLTSKAGDACSHAEICRALGLLPDEWSRHRLEVIISRLRRKVVREIGLELPLRTVRGTGYLWPLGKGA
jgi:DNA-binding response OmpR family regulator